MALTCQATRRLEIGLPAEAAYTCRVSKTLRSHKPTYATRRANWTRGICLRSGLY